MNESEESKNSILAKPLEITPVMFEGEGVIELVDKLDKDLRSIVLDGETKEGRAECITLAANVRSSKAHIDKVGAAVVKPIKDKASVIDKKRKKVKEKLDELAVYLRKPASDWEAAEAKRIQDHRDALQAILALKENAGFLNVKQVEERIKTLNTFREREYEEFSNDGETYIKGIEVSLDAALADAKQREADAAELAALRAQQAAAPPPEVSAPPAPVVAAPAPAVNVHMPAPAQGMIGQGNPAPAAYPAIASRENKRNIHKAIVAALKEHAKLSEDQSQDVVIAIAKGLVPNLSIRY